MASTKTRAGMAAIEDEEKIIASKKGNWELLFACPPSKYTPVDSTLVHDMFAHLKEKAHPEYGTVLLSQALKNFQGKSEKAESQSFGM